MSWNEIYWKEVNETVVITIANSRFFIAQLYFTDIQNKLKNEEGEQ